MASQGPNNPSAAENNTGVGSAAWGSPTNAKTQNGSGAAVSGTNGTISNWLICRGLGFTVPAGATINGVVVDILVRDYSAGNPGVDDQVKLGYLYTPAGNSRASATAYPHSYDWITHGGTADNWGVSLTPSYVNDTLFGVFISSRCTGGGSSAGYANIDAVAVTVYYTEGSGAAQRSQCVIC